MADYVFRAIVLFGGALTVFLLIIFILVTVYIAYVHRKYRLLPGPAYTSFYLGHVPEIQAMRKNGDYVSKLFLQWAEECGTPVFKIYIMHRVLVFLNGTHFVKEVLTKSKYPKSTFTYKQMFNLCGTRFLGNGLLTETDHSKWYTKRTAINPAFHKKYLRMFMDQFNDVGDKWIESLEKQANDSDDYFRMHDSFCRITLDAIAQVGFNNNLNTIACEENPFLSSITTMLKGMSQQFRDPLQKYNPSKQKFRASVRDSVRYLRAYARDVLVKRMDAMAQGEDVPEDILTYIIKCKEVVPELTEDDMIDDYMTLFIAGQETTSNALSFLLLEVGRKPEIMQRMQEEVDRVLEGRPYVDYDDLNKLEYVGQAFKEALRLYPPAPGTSRDVDEDIAIDGYTIPAGSNLIFSFYVIHRLTKYYENPEEFRPERFAPSAPRTLFTYMPFSLGQRSCAGQQFALMESKVLICKFFQKFTFKVDPDQSFEIEEMATLRPKDGARMTIALRG